MRRWRIRVCKVCYCNSGYRRDQIVRLLLVRPPFLFTCLLAMVMTAFHAGAATCQGDVSDAVAAGNLPNSVTLDKGTTAQPLGGTLVFTVPTPALSKEGTQL